MTEEQKLRARIKALARVARELAADLVETTWSDDDDHGKEEHRQDLENRISAAETLGDD